MEYETSYVVMQLQDGIWIERAAYSTKNVASLAAYELCKGRSSRFAIVKRECVHTIINVCNTADVNQH